MGLAAVRDLRQRQVLATPEEIADFEVDVLAAFVLARTAAGVTDSTVRGDVGHLDLIRGWFERPLWELLPSDADVYFGKVLRDVRPATRTARASALSVYFEFLELRYKAELYGLTGRVVECPLDEMNRPPRTVAPRVRVPPTEAEVEQLFSGWRAELVSVRKFAPAARNYAAARLQADVGLRINEARMLDLADVRWELGRFGKLHVRHGKGSRRRGPKERMVPLLNGSDEVLRWFVEDVWGQFDADHTLPGAPLLPSERSGPDGPGTRIPVEVLRRALARAVATHLPEWSGRLTPHTLRHYCASQLYLAGTDILALQELLGHSWIATTMRYIHVHTTRIEDAVMRGQQRASAQWEGLIR